jgi:hypothetical protein
MGAAQERPLDPNYEGGDMRRSRVVAVAVAAFIAGSTATGYGANSGLIHTLWPGDSARVANLDWTCQYLTGDIDYGPYRTNRGLACNRESTYGGVQTLVTGNYVVVMMCQAVTPTYTNCGRELYRHKRNP